MEGVIWPARRRQDAPCALCHLARATAPRIHTLVCELCAACQEAPSAAVESSLLRLDAAWTASQCRLDAASHAPCHLSRVTAPRLHTLCLRVVCELPGSPVCGARVQADTGRTPPGRRHSIELTWIGSGRQQRPAAGKLGPVVGIRNRRRRRRSDALRQ